VVGTGKVGASLLVTAIVPRGPHDIAVICFLLVTGGTPDVLCRNCIASALAGNVLAASRNRWWVASRRLRRVCLGLLIAESAIEGTASLLYLVAALCAIGPRIDIFGSTCSGPICRVRRQTRNVSFLSVSSEVASPHNPRGSWGARCARGGDT